MNLQESGLDAITFPQHSGPSGVVSPQIANRPVLELDCAKLPRELTLDSGFDMDHEVRRAMQHPDLVDFKKWIHFKCGLPSDEYNFGSPDRDPLEQVRDFVNWLVETGRGQYEANGKCRAY